MQAIYTLSTLEQDVKPGEPLKLLQKHFDSSKELLVYLTYFLTEVAGYVETDSYVRSNKHLPTKEDLNVNTKIAGNEILWKIKEDESYQQESARSKPEHKIEKELVKKIFNELTDTPEYKQYILGPERNPKDEREIIEFIFNTLMLENEIFISHLEENFINWDDDSDMVVHVISNYLQKPATINFREVISPDKLVFAKSLLNNGDRKRQTP